MMYLTFFILLSGFCFGGLGRTSIRDASPPDRTLLFDKYTLIGEFDASIDQPLLTTSSPVFVGLTLSGLTDDRLISSVSGVLASQDLDGWISGTANQITVADDGDGSVTLSIPQDIHTLASPTFANLTDSGLTSGRVTYAGTSGLLQDSANLTFDGTNLDCAGTGGFGTLTIGSGSVTDSSGAISFGNETLTTTESVNAKQLVAYGTFTVTNNFTSISGQSIITLGGDIASLDGLYFNPNIFTNGHDITNSHAVYAKTYLSETSGTASSVASCAAVKAEAEFVQGGRGSSLGITDVYMFWAAMAESSGASITDCYALKLEEQTIGATNWQIYSDGGNSAFGGNTRFGGVTTPTVALDVTGAGLISSTLGVTGLSTLTGGVATPKGAVNLGVGDTTFAVTKSFHVVTGDGGGNTIATITGGVDGMVLRLLFVDALVTITDTDAHTVNTVDLSAAFTSADDTVLTLISDGTSWYEVSRSVN